MDSFYHESYIMAFTDFIRAAAGFNSRSGHLLKLFLVKPLLYSGVYYLTMLCSIEIFSCAVCFTIYTSYVFGLKFVRINILAKKNKTKRKTKIRDTARTTVDKSPRNHQIVNFALSRFESEK